MEGGRLIEIYTLPNAFDEKYLFCIEVSLSYATFSKNHQF
jgi:hypothetical protein